MKATHRALWALIHALAVLPAGAAPLISEFQADNQDTVEDDDGDTSDWIEIYNPDNVSVNLGGMALTDDPLLPQKWMFPSITVPARSRLLVWASVKDRTNPAAPLHTNFDLAAAGEYLALTAADGTTKLTEFNTYPLQPPDRSFGSTSEVTVTELLVASDADCRWRVPSAAIAGWETPAFVDTAWNAAKMGIGYDSGPDYLSFIGANGNVEDAMLNIRATCYVRIPFTFTGLAADVTALRLRVRFEDGFAAFLNGTRINPPTSTTTNVPAVLAFDSSTTTARNEALAVTYTAFDITGQKNLLTAGSNLLAVQMVNAGAGSSDILMQAELEVTRVNSSGAPETGYFAIPTPATANTVAPVDGFVDEVTFSVKRGVYTTPQSLALTCLTPGAQIRFTTNGSKPTAATGTVYTAPLNLSTSAVIRAAAFRPDWEPARVKTHTYVFGESSKNQPAAPAGYPTTWGNEYNFSNGTLTGPVVPADYRMDPVITNHATFGPLVVNSITNTLPIVCITGNISDFFDFTNGIYANARLTSGLEISSSMEYFDPLGTDNWQEDAGLRMHGGDAPVEHPKKPFRIYFRKEYGSGRLRHSLFPGSPVDSFDKLQLRPLGHDGWAVPFGSDNESLAKHAMYCRDRFLRQTELDMGRLAHYGKYVHLFINGLYWGFYDIHEVQSKEYWADHKGGLEEDWDVLEHTNTSSPLVDPVDGSDAAMLAALALVTPASNAASPATYAALSQYMDYDEFIDNCIVQMWGAQNDWMGPVFRGTPGVNLTDASRFFNKNWQAARRSRGPDPGRLFWQTWDAEISMGCSLTSLVSTMRVTDFNHTLIGTPTTDVPHVAGTPGPAGVFWYALRKFNPVFRMRVADRLQKHFFNDGAMTVPRNLARLQSFRDLLDLPIVAESARWGDVNTGNPVIVTFNRDDWHSEMNWMHDTYITGRNTTILNQMRALSMWPTVTAPAYSQHGGSVPSGFQLSMSHTNPGGGTIYYTLDGSDPMSAASGNAEVPLIGPGVATPAWYKVPTAQYSGNSWKNVTPPWELIPPADEQSSWLTGPVGLGFDANPTFAPHIATTVAGMRNVNSSLYVRIPFSVTAEQKATMTSLSLRLKYDDGAYVFLNGSTPLHRLNAPTIASPAFNDVATATRADGDAITYQTLDLTPQINTLSPGSGNLLAIQGLNITAADDDFLCTAELIATISGVTPPSGTALTYSGPVTLPQSGRVLARVLQNGAWSPLVETSFIVGQPASAANLVITEFNYHPVTSATEALAGFTDQQFEWIELMNISASPVELTGCRFDDGITFDFSVHSTVQTIAPGQRIIIASDSAAFAARHPGVPVAGTFQSGSNLSNAGERMELLAADGSHIFDFTYDDVAPWPTAPDGGGYSLVLINPASAPDPSLPANWRSSFGPGGSPGSGDADSFTAWAARNSISGTMSEDPDGNGLTNLAEYALGLIPDTGETDGIFSAEFETVVVAGTPDTYLVLRYSRNIAADDVIVTPEMSTNMATWTPLTDWVPPSTMHPDGTEDIACRSPLPVATDSRVYVRVSITTR
jgi:hypothetical protein